MSPIEKYAPRNGRGAVMIVSLVLLMVFSSLAICIASMSGSNIQLAENLHSANRARACAESGFDVVRYWLSRVTIPGYASTEQRLNSIANSLQEKLAAESITNVSVSFNESSIIIPSVLMDSADGSGFSAVITLPDSETICVNVTGFSGQMTRDISGCYNFNMIGHSIFDYGVATKGPLSLSGNVELDGVNVSVEANVFIESESSNLALSIVGNSQIAGNVKIVNSAASVYIQGGHAGIGGETGQDAVDNHVSFGVPATDFPVPEPSMFEQYTTTVIDTINHTYSDGTFENVRIKANSNPVFSGHTTLKGIVFIETPNVIRFSGNADITGIIIGDGDITDNSCQNQMVFSGNVESHPISELPDEPQFTELRDFSGTFIMAPGFGLSFGGNFNALCGVIAGNGIDFSGNAGGIINGTIINYSEEEMTLSGNSDLSFNHSGIAEAPAGFIPEYTMTYNPASYMEDIN
jgi:Tfp pilus assembly protein PilX